MRVAIGVVAGIILALGTTAAVAAVATDSGGNPLPASEQGEIASYGSR